jgi:hypothetical protein
MAATMGFLPAAQVLFVGSEVGVMQDQTGAKPFAAVLADSDLAVARGDLATTSRDLHNLLGRPTASLADQVAIALKAL